MLEHHVGSTFRLFLRVHSGPMILKCSNSSSACAYLLPVSSWFLKLCFGEGAFFALSQWIRKTAHLPLTDEETVFSKTDALKSLSLPYVLFLQMGCILVEGCDWAFVARLCLLLSIHVSMTREMVYSASMHQGVDKAPWGWCKGYQVGKMGGQQLY